MQDVQILLEMTANGEKEISAMSDVLEATSPSLSVYKRFCKVIGVG